MPRAVGASATSSFRITLRRVLRQSSMNSARRFFWIGYCVAAGGVLGGMKSAFSGIWNRVPAEGLHHRIISLQSNENAARRAPAFPVHRLPMQPRFGAGSDAHALHLARADRVGPARAGI